jgi:hypothetical protein
MSATARVILAAASVMVVVFASFVLNDQRVVNLFGFGLATAIAMYALVAMFVLTPATLAILGRAAWWPSRRAARPAAGRVHQAPSERPIKPDVATTPAFPAEAPAFLAGATATAAVDLVVTATADPGAEKDGYTVTVQLEITVRVSTDGTNVNVIRKDVDQSTGKGLAAPIRIDVTT